MLFFDLDGTLIDSSVGVTRCIAHSLERMGHPGLPQAELMGWIGPALRVSYARLFDDPADVERATAYYHERFNTLGIHEHTVFAGIPEALAALKVRGARMAVVTAKNEPQARRIIGSLPFGDVFKDVIGATADGRLSHKPELISEALHRFGVWPGDCTMIGDRHLDIEGAKHHGMRAVGVAWGFGDERELRDAGADLLVESPGLLAGALEAAR